MTTMKNKNIKIYKYLLLLPAIYFAGCSDDELLSSGPEYNPDAITFSASISDACISDLTRNAGDNLPEPLVLTGNDGIGPIYLHSFVTNRIGFEPGNPREATTRGQQVKSGEDLLRIHENFKVLANKKSDGSNYMNWTDAHNADKEANIWYSARTQYWPALENLSFYAVSPASEFEKLSDLQTFDGSIEFDYKSPQGNSDKDAEIQNDLLLSSYDCNKNSHSGRAPLDFSHALSAVKFAVRDVLGGEIINIKIAGVNSQGHCRYYKNSAGIDVIDWTNQGKPLTFSQDFDYEVADRVVDPADETQDEILNERMPEKTFMLIPQQIPDNAEIIITLRRDNVTAAAQSLITVKGKIKDNNIHEWKPGHEYIYTVSTSKDNWVYIFDVRGNKAEGTDNIYVYSPNDERFTDLTNTAFYRVKSYRYRANNQNHVEALPWEASFKGSDSYEVKGNSDVVYPDKFIEPQKWITDLHDSKFSGNGGTTFDRHDIELYPHYLMTDWAGDKKMQQFEPYNSKMSKKETPYDLSTFGGTKSRSTANTYVIDRGGWYALPLYYGNSVVKGNKNTSAYMCNSTDSKALKILTDYNGNAIGGGGVINNVSSAALVWQDAYNMVSEVELVTLNGEKMLRFYVDKDNLQQGNAVVAVKDASGVIMWSWHIWATEHWLDENGLPNALSSSGFFSYKLNSVTQVRESGDAKITHNQGNRTFYMSPYNLGWCDPKNVIYLKRKSTMEFVQHLPGKTTPTATASLPIIQQGETVNYKIGNNTYYQFGRKDPQVGFVDRNKNYKANFGPTNFRVADNKNSDLKAGIRNPHLMYVHTGTDNPKGTKYEDWTNPSYINLWNNSSDVGTDYTTAGTADLWNHVKTIYDPSPVGYVVPNAGVWRALAEKSDGPWGDKSYQNDATYGGNFHGERERKIEAIPDGIYVYILYGTTKSSKKDYVYLIPTGNRWYSNGHVFAETDAVGQETTIKAGLNFNLRMFYGWSSRWQSKNTYFGYSGAIGIDAATGNKYFMAPHFIGRRAMGRPVRAIRDPNF